MYRVNLNNFCYDVIRQRCSKELNTKFILYLPYLALAKQENEWKMEQTPKLVAKGWLYYEQILVIQNENILFKEAFFFFKKYDVTVCCSMTTRTQQKKYANITW